MNTKHLLARMVPCYTYLGLLGSNSTVVAEGTAVETREDRSFMMELGSHIQRVSIYVRLGRKKAEYKMRSHCRQRVSISKGLICPVNFKQGGVLTRNS